MIEATALQRDARTLLQRGQMVRVELTQQGGGHGKAPVQRAAMARLCLRGRVAREREVAAQGAGRARRVRRRETRSAAPFWQAHAVVPGHRRSP
ncbi:MAG: hypothetical protein AMXMBFR59_22930 [Rhodanobacteraceae bacterium]